MLCYKNFFLLNQQYLIFAPSSNVIKTENHYIKSVENLTETVDFKLQPDNCRPVTHHFLANNNMKSKLCENYDPLIV